MVSQAEANAYDRIIDAAAELFELIEGAGIEVDEIMLEELTIYLAKNATKIREIVKKIPAQYFFREIEEHDCKNLLLRRTWRPPSF